MSTYAEYDAIPAHRWSDVKYMYYGARAYREHMQAEEAEDSDAMAFGRAAHVAAFEPDMLPLQLAVWKGGTRRGDTWDAFLAANEGMEPIREIDYLRALRVRDAVHSHPEAKKLLRRGTAEKTITWTDPETGLPCKARMDHLVRGRHPAVSDLKTTTARLGDLRKFRNSAADLLYHGQLGMYRDGCKVALKLSVGANIIAAETSGGFEVAVLRLSGDELWAGSDLFHELLCRIAECERTGKWPFRYPKAVSLELPSWTAGLDNDIAGIGLELLPKGA